MDILLIIGTILTIHIFAWLTPWPLFVLIISNSLKYWRVTWLWTALGIASWNFIHISYAIWGIYFLSGFTKNILFLMSLIGGLYLFYLGIKVWSSKVISNKIKTNKKEENLTKIAAFKQGITLNLLSPKAGLFFISIIASISWELHAQSIQVALLFLMPINSFIMAYILSIFFTQKRIRKQYQKYNIIINKILWGVLVLFGVWILYSIII